MRSQKMLKYFPASPANTERLGIDDLENMDVPVRTLPPGTEITGRMLPPLFADEPTDEYFLCLVTHHWPGGEIEHNQCSAYSVCPRHTHPDLIRCRAGDVARDCPACEAGVDVRLAFVVYCVVDGPQGGGMGIKITNRNKDVLRSMIMDGVFDLKGGCKVRITVTEDWTISYECLEDDAVDRQEFLSVCDSGMLGYRKNFCNNERLKSMAQARTGWTKVGMPFPGGGLYHELMRQLRHSTLIPVPWGCKGPVDVGWQNTPFEAMSDWDYFRRFDMANIGLLAGRDQTAVDAGQIPNQITLILDPDDPDFLEAVYKLNHHWLDDTFCVTGNRGCKWFYAVAEEGNEGLLKGVKIMRRKPDGSHEVVGERLSSGEQGIVFGLHPVGKMYEPNKNGILQIKPNQFKLPENCYLSNVVDELAGGRRRPGSIHAGAILESNRGLAGVKHQRGFRHAGSILEQRFLQNKTVTAKGLVAACPACLNEGRDTAMDNLLIYPDGRYVCARFINDTGINRYKHNQDIYRLVGCGRKDYE